MHQQVIHSLHSTRMRPQSLSCQQHLQPATSSPLTRRPHYPAAHSMSPKPFGTNAKTSRKSTSININNKSSGNNSTASVSSRREVLRLASTAVLLSLPLLASEQCDGPAARAQTASAEAQVFGASTAAMVSSGIGDASSAALGAAVERVDLAPGLNISRVRVCNV